MAVQISSLGSRGPGSVAVLTWQFNAVLVDINVNLNLTPLPEKKGVPEHPFSDLAEPAFPARCPDQPYRYFGSHSVRPGQMYMNTMHKITISM